MTLDENLVDRAATGTIAATNLFVRNGGDWIHRMIQHVVPGLELFGVVYDDALGNPVDRDRLVATRGAAVRFFLPPPDVR